MGEVRLDVQDGMIGIDPDAEMIRAARQFDTAVGKVQGLAELRRAGEGVGRELNADAAQLDELADLGPCIGLGDEQNQVAILLRPDVGAHVTVANGHGVVLIAAKFLPGDVVGGGVGAVHGRRGRTGCEGHRSRKRKHAGQDKGESDAGGAGSAADCGSVQCGYEAFHQAVQKDLHLCGFSGLLICG